MTTIAWDSRTKTLAGDKLRTVGNTPVPATKVFRAKPGAPFDAALYAASGDSWECVSFREWMDAPAGTTKPALKNMGFVVITRAGVCLYGGEGLVVHDILFPYFSIGSGADYALGAMAAGASAREAVEIASALDVNSGLGVDVLELAA